jgi:response regulator RpfG family c-di-GMP phosphodiesterase
LSIPFILSKVRPATALVVQDEELARLIVAALLWKHSYTVIEAGSGDQAARMLRSGTLLNVVFKDMHMPGFVASRHISSLPAGLADGLFSKPFDLASVVDKIDDVPKADAMSREWIGNGSSARFAIFSSPPNEYREAGSPASGA